MLNNARCVQQQRRASGNTHTASSNKTSSGLLQHSGKADQQTAPADLGDVNAQPDIDKLKDCLGKVR
jgi:hypothetical protein